MEIIREHKKKILRTLSRVLVPHILTHEWIVLFFIVSRQRYSGRNANDCGSSWRESKWVDFIRIGQRVPEYHRTKWIISHYTECLTKDYLPYKNSAIHLWLSCQRSDSIAGYSWGSFLFRKTACRASNSVKEGKKAVTHRDESVLWRQAKKSHSRALSSSLSEKHASTQRQLFLFYLPISSSFRLLPFCLSRI